MLSGVLELVAIVCSTSASSRVTTRSTAEAIIGSNVIRIVGRDVLEAIHIIGICMEVRVHTASATDGVHSTERMSAGGGDAGAEHFVVVAVADHTSIALEVTI